jgi:mono/diheme cytochrome c family protein
MNVRLIDLLLAALLAGAPANATDRDLLVAEGKELFRSQGCYGCHMVGKMGTPIATDLSRAGSRWQEAFLLRWLRDPAAQKPTAHMPRITLTEAEVRALAAYLSSLK